MRMRAAGLLVLPAVLLCAGVSAQVPWETPFMVPPVGGEGLGIYLVGYRQDDLGVAFTYRSTALPTGLGVRAGIADQGGAALFAGIDMAGSLVPATEEVPVDVAWVLGVGVGGGNDVVLSIPAGVSVGGTIQSENARLEPYLTPRLVADLFGPGDTLDLSFAVDLGLNLSFNADYELRFAVSGGDREAIAAGVALPVG